MFQINQYHPQAGNVPAHSEELAVCRTLSRATWVAVSLHRLYPEMIIVVISGMTGAEVARYGEKKANA